jgi:hypothetical protein
MKPGRPLNAAQVHPFSPKSYEWKRVGRGEGFSLRGSPEVVQALLADGIPEVFLPCRIVGADALRFTKGGYTDAPFLFDIARLPEQFAEPDGAHRMLWLWSEVLTPGLQLVGGDRGGRFCDACCSLSGLISLRSAVEAASWSVGRVARVSVDRVDTVISYDGYKAIFTALKKLAGKRGLIPEG